jgi:hypothetical protein
MFDIEKMEDKVSPLVTKLNDVKDELEAREMCMSELPYISGLSNVNWEHEKLAILRLGIISETKLDKIRKTSYKAQVVEDAEIEQAREKVKRIMCTKSGKGYSYLFIDGNDLRPMPSQEMTPLVKLISEENKLEESVVYERIHAHREIESMTTHIMPNGKTHYVMDKLTNGKFEAVCHVSIGEMISNHLKRLKNIEINREFENKVRSECQYIFDIYEYALALKFTFEKANCIWLREKSDTGKTFFLGAREVKDYIFFAESEIKENDFVGDPPERWGKALFFFIDEAKKFSSDMKNARLPYRMNYGGRVELDKPLQILSSDNEISDLTQGVDKQIENRVINIHHKGTFKLRKWLDDNNMDATTTQYMWQKIILQFISDKLQEWSEHESLQVVASKYIKEFKKEYKTERMKDISDKAKELTLDAIVSCINSDGDPCMSTTNEKQDYRDFILLHNKKYHIRSPKAFFKLLLSKEADEKLKAFFKSYPNNEAIAKIFESEYEVKTINNRTFRTINTGFDVKSCNAKKPVDTGAK